MDRVSLPGSERIDPAGATRLGPAAPTERLNVSVIVRRQDRPSFDTRVRRLSSGLTADALLTRAQFADRHGANPLDLAAVGEFARAAGLQILQQHAARRTLVLTGTVAQFNAAFSIELQRMHHAGGSYRGRTGWIWIPASLEGVIEAVLGLDDRPQARPHFRLRAPQAAGVSYTPPQLAGLYGFPPGDGAGQCIGIIELGGGYHPADLKAYFAGLGIANPTVVAVAVDQAANAPTGDANGPDGEVMLDIEVVGALVPAARIVVYFAPNTDAGFLDAITTAIHDTANAPDVLSISWGGPESSWTAQAITAMDEAFQAAATLGVTVCVASGDNGSGDGVADGADHVDFPASSPYALACGGTSLQASAATIQSETVWNDGAGGGASGGGISNVFPVPAFQSGLAALSSTGTSLPLTHRGVPDVAGDADPQTGYDVRIDGRTTVIGGTSAVAPLWAALIARLNERQGHPSGYLHPLLYRNPGQFRDITRGNNGSFAAAPGWDACTGLGSPDGSALGA